jgi:DNA-binding cell septation regulator SpoVG
MPEFSPLSVSSAMAGQKTPQIDFKTSVHHPINNEERAEEEESEAGGG